MRGYSSECDVWWADVADDAEDESTQQNGFVMSWHDDDDSSPVPVQPNDTDTNIFSSRLIDFSCTGS